MEDCKKCGAPRTAQLHRTSWSLRLSLLVLIGAYGATVVGPSLTPVFEGVNGALSQARPMLIGLLGLVLLSIGVGSIRLKRPVCRDGHGNLPAWLLVPIAAPELPADAPAEPGSEQTPFRADRRSFLQTAGAVGASTVAATAAGIGSTIAPQAKWLPVVGEIAATVPTLSKIQRPEWQGAQVKNYRRLGRTNAMVSDISLGSGRIRDNDGKRVAIESIRRGVNYFDTAPDYSDESSERILGEAIQETGNREDIFLATKFCTANGHLATDASVAEIMTAVEGSLQRLQTDYVDLIHIHSCDDVNRLMSPTTHEAFDRLREQGKARFLGFSSHTPSLPEVARAAMASNRFDVMMLAYHWGLWPEIGEVMDQAHAMDMGVVAMKTLKGAKATNLAGFEDESGSFPQSAFRWVLDNPSVSCLVVSFSEDQHCDEYLYASGQSPRPTDIATLEKYDRLVSADYCRPHCGECLSSCPQGRPIDTILRYDMYLADYRDPVRGREKYARLVASGLDAAGCEACPAPCLGSCPHELPIRAKMVRAHERLIEV